MKSRTIYPFERLLRQLPVDVRQQVYAAFRLFKENPKHPSLHFERKNTGRHKVVSVHPGNDDYRALDYIQDGMIKWFWIGTHNDYNQMLKRIESMMRGIHQRKPPSK